MYKMIPEKSKQEKNQRNTKALRNKYEPNQLDNDVKYTFEKYSKQLYKTVVKGMLAISGNEMCNC